MLKVVHISTADNVGGAARAAFRIHTELLRVGLDSRMLTGFKVEVGREDIDCLPRQVHLGEKVRTRLVRRLEQLTGLEYLLLPWKRQFLEHPFVRDADIVHLHNLHGGFFSHAILPDLSRQKKLIWSIHDLWPLTGHCYYPDMYDCSRWRTGCGRCPGLRQENHYPLSIDSTKFLWNIKRSIYSRSEIKVVAPSTWMLEQIRSSPLLGGFEGRVIPYGLDTDIFRPIDRRTARDVLSLPQSAKIVLFSADGLFSERKGWSLLREALRRLEWSSSEHVVLLAAGHASQLRDFEAAFPVIYLGHVNNDRLMVLAYSAADLFVLPTLADNLPNGILESMACGTPVVAFHVGGVPDAVRPMETGYLAARRDAVDLARGIDLLLENAELREHMGRRSREVAVREYSLMLQAQRFHDLYQEALATVRAQGYVGSVTADARSR